MDNETENLRQVVLNMTTAVGGLTKVVTNLAKEQVEIYRRIIRLENKDGE